MATFPDSYHSCPGLAIHQLLILLSSLVFFLQGFYARFYLKNCFLYIVAIPLLFLIIGIFITLCKDLSLFVEGFPRLLSASPWLPYGGSTSKLNWKTPPITRVPAVRDNVVNML